MLLEGVSFIITTPKKGIAPDVEETGATFEENAA